MDRKIKVLVVDDDDPIRMNYADIFKSGGFEVIEALDGLDGLNKASTEAPDVIFTGIIMPKLDGFSMKDALAKNVATANIPVMMLSHMGREEDRKKAIEMGVKEFFVLGMITPNDLLEKINALFNSRKYNLNFNPEALDAQKIVDDFHLKPGFQCEKCGKQKVLSLESSDVINNEFKARFVCPNCK